MTGHSVKSDPDEPLRRFLAKHPSLTESHENVLWSLSDRQEIPLKLFDHIPAVLQSFQPNPSHPEPLEVATADPNPLIPTSTFRDVTSPTPEKFQERQDSTEVFSFNDF